MGPGVLRSCSDRPQCVTVAAGVTLPTSSSSFEAGLQQKPCFRILNLHFRREASHENFFISHLVYSQFFSEVSHKKLSFLIFNPNFLRDFARKLRLTTSCFSFGGRPRPKTSSFTTSTLSFGGGSCTKTPLAHLQL